MIDRIDRAHFDRAFADVRKLGGIVFVDLAPARDFVHERLWRGRAGQFLLMIEAVFRDLE
jgi:hypothetical protein